MNISVEVRAESVAMVNFILDVHTNVTELLFVVIFVKIIVQNAHLAKNHVRIVVYTAHVCSPVENCVFSVSNNVFGLAGIISVQKDVLSHAIVLDVTNLAASYCNVTTNALDSGRTMSEKMPYMPQRRSDGNFLWN